MNNQKKIAKVTLTARGTFEEECRKVTLPITDDKYLKKLLKVLTPKKNDGYTIDLILIMNNSKELKRLNYSKKVLNVEETIKELKSLQKQISTMKDCSKEMLIDKIQSGELTYEEILDCVLPDTYIHEFAKDFIDYLDYFDVKEILCNYSNNDVIYDYLNNLDRDDLANIVDNYLEFDYYEDEFDE